jgi:hypothetical protein
MKLFHDCNPCTLMHVKLVIPNIESKQHVVVALEASKLVQLVVELVRIKTHSF